MAWSGFKNLFVVGEESQTTAPVTNNVVNTIATVVTAQNSTPNVVNATPNINPSFNSEGKIIGVVDTKFMDTLCKVLDSANIDGPDYQELKAGAEQMAAAGITDENSRIIAAYIGLKAGSTKLNKKHVLDSIDFYINTIENERKVGINELSNKRKINVDDKKANIQTTINEIESIKGQISDLQKLLNEKTASINISTNEIAAASRECDQKEADFNCTIDTIINKLASDKQLLSTILPD